MSAKDTVGKPKLRLLPYAALAAMADIREYGIRKYKDDDAWKGVPSRDFVDAALRHSFKYLSGEHKDSESGLDHLAHAACSLLLALSVDLNSDAVADKNKQNELEEFFGLHAIRRFEYPELLARTQIGVSNLETDGGAGS